MFDINLLLAAIIIIASAVSFILFIDIRRNTPHTLVLADDYEDEDLTITLINSSIVQESDFK